MQKSSERIVIFLLIFSPLAFGTVEPWSLLIMEGGAFLGLFLYLVSAYKNDQKLYEIPGLLPLLCFLGYILFQLIPLPAFLVRILSPGIHQIYIDTVGIFQPVDWLPLTLNRQETLSEFFRFGAYAAFYILVVQLFSRAAYLKRVVLIVASFAASLSIVAILQHFTAEGKIYWFREFARGTHFGPYVNRNHYAGFMEIVTPLVVVLAFYLKPIVIADTLKERIVSFFDHPNIHRYLGFSFGALIMAVSVFVSISRGGIVSLMIALSILGILLSRYRSKTKGALILSYLCFLLMISIGWFGWNPIFERFNNIRGNAGEITENRLNVWRDSQHTVACFPITGTGFGTFQHSYQIYRTLPKPANYTHAHNDYLELLTNGGIIGTAVVVWFLVSIFTKFYSGLKRRREPYMIYLGYGAFVGTLSILLHAATDFNFQIGANGLYFFFLFTLLVAAPNTRIRFRSTPTRLHLCKKSPSLGLLFLTAILLGGCLFTNGGNLIAKNTISEVLPLLMQKDIPEEEREPLLKKISRANIWNPMRGDFSLFTADLITRFKFDIKDPEPIYQQAIFLSPTNSYFHNELAMHYTKKGKNDLADALFRASLKYDPMNDQAYSVYGAWLLGQKKRAQGLQLIQKAISLSPQKTRSYITLMVEQGIGETDINETLPDKVVPHIIFAEHLEKAGSFDAANTAFEKALLYLPNENEVKPEYFLTICKYYREQLKPENALDVMRTAINYLPDNVSIRLMLGKLYEDQGISYRAIEEYQKVLMIDPYHKIAKHRIAKLEKESTS